MGHRPHLLLPPPWLDERIVVADGVRHHLERVLRRTELDVDYTDGAGRVGSGSYQAGAVVRGAERTVPAPTPRVVMAVAAPRAADAQRVVVEKLAELGVDELVWLRTRHGGHRPPPPRRAAAWATAALEQSRGARLMEIRGPVDLDTLASEHRVAVAHRGGEPLALDNEGVVVVAVGPEGGFAPDELTGPGLTCFGLGPRTLRVETAAVAAAGLALHLTGRWGPLPDD